jgi:hypothetical protein
LLINTVDPALQALFTQSQLGHRLETIAQSATINWPNLTFRNIISYKKRQKAEELKQWSQLPSKGKGVLSFQNDQHGNCWLYKPELLKPSRFLSALRLRSGTTADSATLKKVIPQSSVTCRRCGAQLKPLAHVLGQCTHMKKMVTNRHNSIRDFISSETARKNVYKIFEEPSNGTSDGTLKPDLV